MCRRAVQTDLSVGPNFTIVPIWPSAEQLQESVARSFLHWRIEEHCVLMHSCGDEQGEVAKHDGLDANGSSEQECAHDDSHGAWDAGGLKLCIAVLLRFYAFRTACALHLYDEAYQGVRFRAMRWYERLLAGQTNALEKQDFGGDSGVVMAHYDDGVDAWVEFIGVRASRLCRERFSIIGVCCPRSCRPLSFTV